MTNLNPETKNYTIGRGDVFIAQKRADGTLGGERPIGNTPAFGITIQSTALKHYSSSAGMRVQDREVPIQVDYDASFTTDDISPKNLAALLLGSAATVSITAGVATVENFTAVEQGLTYQMGISAANPMGLQQISNVSVATGGVVHVLNTDYTVDLVMGRVTVVEGGGIADGTAFAVTYDHAAVNQTRIVSAANVVEGALRFISHNPEGIDQDFYLPNVKLSPNGEYQVKVENDWSKMQFKVSIGADAAGVQVYCDGRVWTP